MIKKRLCLSFCLVWAIMLLYPLLTLASPSKRIQNAKYIYAIYRLKTPRKLVWYNAYHFEYMRDIDQFDTSDYWQNSLQFFINKRGDCEDFAIWNYHVLKYHGYNPQIILIKGREDKTPHAIVRIIYRGKTIYIDNYEYYNKLPKNLKEIRIIDNRRIDKIEDKNYN